MIDRAGEIQYTVCEKRKRERLLHDAQGFFYMPQNFQKENAFGAATLGLAGMPNCPADAVCSFPLQPKGVVLNGTYEEILTAIPGNDYQAAIVLCGNAGDENCFLKRLSQVLHCPSTSRKQKYSPAHCRRSLRGF